MKPKTKKKRAPVDSTMRNVRAANKRINVLEEWMGILDAYITDLYEEIGKLKKKRGKK